MTVIEAPRRVASTEDSEEWVTLQFDLTCSWEKWRQGVVPRREALHEWVTVVFKQGEFAGVLFWFRRRGVRTWTLRMRMRASTAAWLMSLFPSA